MTDLLYKDEVYAIVGAAMDVYNDLGSGFLENVYLEAMEIELESRKIPSKTPQEIHIKYKGRTLKKFYIADLVFTKESPSRPVTRHLRDDSTDYQTPIRDD